MTSIVFLDRETLPDDVQLPVPGPDCTITFHARTSSDEVLERLRNADVAITNKVRITSRDLAAAGNLRLIAVAATGVDCVDLAACREAGVTVCNIRDYATDTVPEHLFAMILALQRSLVPYRNSVLQGRWQQADQFCYFDYPIRDVAGATLGIVGRGTLGLGLAKLSEAFGMRVLFAGRKNATKTEPPYTPFDEVLADSDILSLNCPLTSDTRNLFGPEEFGKMAKRPIIINGARGGLIDEIALKNALDSGLISGAGLDVSSPEPPPPDSILMEIASYDNVILTPHVAWASKRATQSLANQLMRNIALFLEGTPRNVVT